MAPGGSILFNFISLFRALIFMKRWCRSLLKLYVILKVSRLYSDLSDLNDDSKKSLQKSFTS